MLDKSNGIPYYRQIADDLLKQMERGAYDLAERLPSETELSIYYNVNRHTIRQAIGELASRGLVYRLKGKGTYPVKNSVINYKVSSRTCFTRNIRELGLAPRATVLKALEMPAPPEIAAELQLNPGEPLTILEILRFADDYPFSVATSYLPSVLVPGLLQFLDDFSSLYHLLEKHYNIHPIRVRSSLQAVLPSLDDARLLQMSPHSPVLQVKSTMLKEKGVAVEYCVARFRGDRSCLEVDFSCDAVKASDAGGSGV